MNEYIQQFFYLSQQYFDRYIFLFPLGVIGIWRWSIWIIKEIIGLHYHPKTKAYKASVSLVVPVYNEDPIVFKKALLSWVANKPFEIIAVIDYTDVQNIAIFTSFSKEYAIGKLIVTRTPGKRPALVAGIKKAKGDIIALVDSDTIWDTFVIRNGLPPFHDAKVGGVATYQSVLEPKTFAQKVFDVQLDLRYRHEYPFLAAAGNALVCLSGRTAFYRKETITPLLPDLLHETFLGKPVISGDDKCLTYLVLKKGWKVAYQSNSHVYTPGMKDLNSYIKQRLRWSRNSLRADMKAIFQGWPIYHPALLFFQIDKFLQSFVVILSPIFFFVALYFHMWITALIIACWWMISRTIKMYAHLFHKPTRFSIVPGYIIYAFFSGIVRIYAFFTLNTQGWITRWDKSRLPQLQFLQIIPAYAATVVVVIGLTYSVYLYKQYTYFIPQNQRDIVLARALQTIKKIDAKGTVLGTQSLVLKDLLAKRYKPSEGETLASVAQRYQVDPNTLLFANNAKVGSIWQQLPSTMVVTIPGKDTTLVQQEKYLSMHFDTTPVKVTYDKDTNTLVVFGRGQQVSLRDIQKHSGKDFVVVKKGKIWEMKTNIFLTTGITLVLDKQEVTWLRMESNDTYFTYIRSVDADIQINGVKITSWDSSKKDVDTNIKNGRSFLMAKDNSRMDIYNSELAYLGYETADNLTISPYGVSWKMSRDKLKKVMLTGEVIKNKFHHNYFGTYTYGATGMKWEGNEFSHNIRYGLDPHDDSNGFLVVNNKAYNNGSHGIIFSKRCMYNVIRNNLSYNNKLHGIMLHEKSDNNLIEHNTLYGNTSGVSLWHASNNIVRNNAIDNNRHGIRVNERSNNNVLENNTIGNSLFYAIYLYDKANHNHIVKNNVTYNHVGLYIKSDNNIIQANTLYNNNVGVYFLANASNNVVDRNIIKESLVYGVYTKITNVVSNTMGVNVLADNRKDISGEDITL